MIRFGRGTSHTEACREDVILLRPFACRELIVQTELAIAVVAAQSSIFCCALSQRVIVFDLGSGLEGVKGPFVEMQDIVEGGGRGGAGLGGVEGDDCAIRETSTLAKRGRRYIQGY